ncbi:MAG: transrane protein YoaK [bacterium]|nr:transrane protein YoaK [bacterium]
MSATLHRRAEGQTDERSVPRRQARRRIRLSVPGTAAVAVVLSAVAGFVDIVGWLTLAHVYSANMTGNTIHLAQGITAHRGVEMFGRVWPILCFVLGLFVSELVYEVMQRKGEPASASVTLGIEALFIGLVVVVLPLPPDTAVATAAGLHFFVPVGLLSTAMGLQNATLVRVGASSVYTTHVTGNLTRFAREAAHWTVSAFRRQRVPAQGSARRAMLMATVWTSYLCGGVLGVLGRGAWGLRALVFPLVVLVALVVLDRVRPLGGHDMPREPQPIF